MKKEYTAPSQFVCELHAGNAIMQLSLQGGNADGSADVLTKENNNWDFWDDEDEGYTPIKDKKFF